MSSRRLQGSLLSLRVPSTHITSVYEPASRLLNLQRAIMSACYTSAVCEATDVPAAAMLMTRTSAGVRTRIDLGTSATAGSSLTLPAQHRSLHCYQKPDTAMTSKATQKLFSIHRMKRRSDCWQQQHGGSKTGSTRATLQYVLLTTLPERVGQRAVIMPHERRPQRLQHRPVKRCKRHILGQAGPHACAAAMQSMCRLLQT